MAEYLELWMSGESRLVPLDEHRVTVGRLDTNDIAVPTDRLVSRSHAVIERIGATWCVRDLSSTNGTYVDGQRIVADQPLRPNAEVRIGETRMIFRVGGAAATDDQTAVPSAMPVVTARERDVLLALFRFRAPRDMYAEPASTREIARALGVSDAAVKQHLLRLYDKFRLIGSDRSRSCLANEALKRGVVTMSDLRQQTGVHPSES